MDNIAKKLLHDILTSINSIDDYIGVRKDFNEYKNNKQLRRSVETFGELFESHTCD